MGIAVAELQNEALESFLPILRAFGGLVSVHYPRRPSDGCTVRFVTTAVPDDGEHEVIVEFSQSVKGATVTWTTTLRLK